jgi:hypothetical protein
MKPRRYHRWAILIAGNRLTPDGLLGRLDTGMARLYHTRQEARDDPDVRKFNAMLRRRKDLRSPPHNWRAYRPVKVVVTVELADD